MNKTRYRTLTTYVSHFSSPPTHTSTHDTLETMYVFLGPSYNLHITNTGDSSYLPSISLLSLSTISTTDRKQTQAATSFTNSEVVIEVVRVPLGRIARRLAHPPAALDEATAVSFSAFCASLSLFL